MSNNDITKRDMPDLPCSFSAIKFQFCGPCCWTNCRSFSSSAGRQCPRGQDFASSPATPAIAPRFGVESDLYKGKRKVRKRVLTEKEKLMEVGLKLWMVSHFYWLNTNFFFFFLGGIIRCC